MRRSRRHLSVFVCLALFLGGSACARHLRQQGESMSPTIPAGSSVIVDRVVGTINRGDIVIMEREGHSFIRRVVVLPGERFDIVDGRVRVDGKALDEPYVAAANRSHDNYGPARMAPDQYFLMGDNRRAALDSRLQGGILRSEIWARAGVSFRMIH